MPISAATRLLVLVATLAVVAAACGEGDEGAATTMAPVTTTEAAATTEPAAGQPTTTTQPVTATTVTSAAQETTTTTDPYAYEDDADAPEPVAGEPMEPVSATPVEPEQAESIVAMAVADLMERTGASSEEITVQSVEAVVWPDGSLGCPQPGMAYTQVLTDGSRIVLTHAGIDYAYHSGGSRDPFLCARG